MKIKIASTTAAIALCIFAACSDDSSSPTTPSDDNNSQITSSSDIGNSSSSIGEECSESPMAVEEMKTLLESFNFPTTTPGTETVDAETPMYKVSHNEFSVTACDTTYPAIMQAAEWKEEASESVGSGNFISFVGYRYIKKYGCTDIAISFICRDAMTSTTNFYVEYLKNARKEHLFVGTYE